MGASLDQSRVADAHAPSGVGPTYSRQQPSPSSLVRLAASRLMSSVRCSPSPFPSTNIAHGTLCSPHYYPPCSSSGRTPAIEGCSGAAYPPIPHASSICGKIAGTARSVSRLLHLSGPILLFTVPPAVRARFVLIARRGMVGVVGVRLGVWGVKPRVPKKLTTR